MRGGVGQRIAVRDSNGEQHPEPVRAFLAVPVEEPALGAVQSLLARLRADVPGMRWVHAGGLHLTVHFFGEVSDERVAVACGAVRPVAGSTALFDVRLDHLGDFHDGAVLWCGVTEGTDALTSLALACRAALSASGFATEQRRYRAHCTLGRSRRALDTAARAAWHAANVGPGELPLFTARRLVLFESRLSEGATEHVPRDELAFGG